MATAKFRAVIFDIGRVLIRMDISDALRDLAEDVSLSPQEIWSALQKDPRWRDWQEGRISPHDWHLHVTKRFGSKLSFEKFVEVWNHALDPIPMHEDIFFQKLSRGHRLALLSNTDPFHVAHMEKTYDFFRFFPVRVYSCRVGASKPSPLVYKEALQACKVQAEEAIYIDDVPAYAEAAGRLGMKGIVFESPEQLQTVLRGLGVIAN